MGRLSICLFLERKRELGFHQTLKIGVVPDPKVLCRYHYVADGKIEAQRVNMWSPRGVGMDPGMSSCPQALLCAMLSPRSYSHATFSCV